MKSQKKLLVGGGALALILVVAGFVATTTKHSNSSATDGPTKPVAVEVAPVNRATIADNISAVGTVAAMQDVAVSSETAGRITAVFVKVGDAVAKGQTLVQVDDDLKKVALEQARAQALAAETSHMKAQKDFERTEKLYRAGDVADVEMEGYRLALHSAEAQLQGARAGLKLAERQLADTRIAAPISGIVASRTVEVGEMVGPGREVANLVDIASVKIKLNVPEEEIGKIRPGQRGTVRLDSYPGEVYEGKVFSVGSKSETPNGHTYPVELLVKNKGKDHLKVGMFARVDVLCSVAENVLTISKESLVSDDGAPAVFVVEDGKARLRQLALGIRGDKHYEVVKGVKEHELVVSFGQKGLKDGVPVQFSTKAVH